MKSSPPEVVATARTNPGETLRKMRESRDLTLDEVARQLNLTAQSVRQLEEGAFDQLPGHTFARGYVRAYAKFLGLDQAHLVNEFDHYTGTNASGSSVSSLSRIEEPARVSQSLLKFFSVTALLALCAAGFYWWSGDNARMLSSTERSLEHVEVESADGTVQIHPLDEPEDQAVVEAQSAEPVPSELPLPAAPAAEPAAGTSAPQVEGAPVVAEPAPATPGELAASEVPAPAQAEVVEQPATAVSEPAPALAAGEAQINLQFTADCWTQLTDADGKVLLSALKRRGDSVELRGKAPLELRLGFARGAVVMVNGQTVDTAPFVRGETARLKLGQ